MFFTFFSSHFFFSVFRVFPNRSWAEKKFSLTGCYYTNKLGAAKKWNLIKILKRKAKGILLPKNILLFFSIGFTKCCGSERGLPGSGSDLREKTDPDLNLEKKNLPLTFFFRLKSQYNWYCKKSWILNGSGCDHTWKPTIFWSGSDQNIWIRNPGL